MRYNRAMRIAVFTDIYAPWATGGIASSIQAQKGELERLGHEVVVFCPGFDAKERGVVTVPTYKYLRINGAAIAKAPSLIKQFVMKRMPELADFDVIHVHYEAGCSIAGIELARELGLPLVQTMHGREDMAIEMNVPRPLQVLTAAALDDLHRYCLPHESKVKRDDFQAPTLSRRRMWQLMVNHANHADIVTAPAEHFAAKLRHYGVKRPIRVVSNGVNDDLVEQKFPVRKLAAGETLRMLWNSRVSQEKRILPFLEALSQLRRPFQLDVYGDGNDLARALRFVEKHSLPVQFHGKCSREEIIQQMARAHLAVMASYNFDVQSMILLEAEATGLPVFLCDPNLREVLPEGSYVLAAGPEPEAMTAAMEALPAGRIEEMSRVMMAHRREALQSTQIQKLLAVYEEALRLREGKN